MGTRFKINEIQQHRFYMIPKELFTNPKYKKLNNDARVLYSLLKDRMELSKKNNWVNDDGELYLIFSRENAGEILNLSKPTVVKAFKLLNEIGLIEEVRQGLNKPNIIYICHLEAESGLESRKLKFFTSGSKKSSLQEVKNFNPNDTEFNDTEITTTTEKERIDSCLETYRKNIGKVHDVVLGDIAYYINEHYVQVELIEEYIKEAARRNKLNWAYVKTMIDGNLKEGIHLLSLYLNAKDNLKAMNN